MHKIKITWIISTIAFGLFSLLGILFYNSISNSTQVVILAPSSPFLEEHEDIETKSRPSYISQRLKNSLHSTKEAKEALVKARLEVPNGNFTQPWSLVGPSTGTGRITDVEFDPSSENIFYAGAASGGLFKSEDKGSTWNNVFSEAPFLSIGDLAVSPSNSNILYLGTGEANGSGNSIVYNGYGVYKSTDAGATWSHLGLENTNAIGRVAIHPENPDIVFVAATGAFFATDTSRGIYRTQDGGVTWERVLFISETTGGIDLVINPDSPDQIVAAMWEHENNHPTRTFTGEKSGIYRSTNGGDTWQQVTQGLPAPGTVLGKISLAQFKADPNLIFALIVNSSNSLEGIYRSNNGGASWSKISSGELNITYGQYCTRLEVHPTNSNILYIPDLDLHKSTNGGSNWSKATSNMHVDFHAVKFHPTNPNLILVGSDGGFYWSENSGSNWSKATGYPITQFYQMAVDPNDINKVYGGTQDNGTFGTSNGGTGNWNHINGGDGFYVVVDPNNSNTIYSESQFGRVSRSDNGGGSFSLINGTLFNDQGERFNWNTPIVLDPSNSNTVYIGSQKLWRSENRGSGWQAVSDDLSNGSNVRYFGTITTIAVSPNGQKLLVGTDDGNVWKSGDRGSNWQKISSSLPNQWVTRVIFDPNVNDKIFVTFSGFKNADNTAHIFVSENLGDSWQPIHGDLPEIPVNDIIVDKNDSKKLFIATDGGVFVSPNLGAQWFRLGQGLPHSPILDFDVHWESRTLFASTYGSSIYKVKIDDIVSIASAKKDKGKLSVSFSGSRQINIQLNLESSEEGIIQIINPKGRIIHKWDSQLFSKGQTQIQWGGSTGQTLLPGVYLINYQSKSRVLNQRFRLLQ